MRSSDTEQAAKCSKTQKQGQFAALQGVIRVIQLGSPAARFLRCWATPGEIDRGASSFQGRSARPCPVSGSFLDS